MPSFATRITSLIPFLIGIDIIIFDQGMKWWMRHLAYTGHTFSSSFLAIDYFENPGIAFGIPFPTIPLLILTITLLGVLVMHRTKTPQDRRPSEWVYALIAAGALSNFVDRAVLGITIDYLRIGVSVLNLADISIIVGALLFLWHEIRQKDSVHTP